MTKTNSVLFANSTLTAGSALQSSTAVDLTTLGGAFGAMVVLKFTNGGTGPTIPAAGIIQISDDNSNWYDYGPNLIGDTASSAVRSWVLPIDIGAMYLRILAGSNTAQNVVIRAEVAAVTV